MQKCKNNALERWFKSLGLKTRIAHTEKLLISYFQGSLLDLDNTSVRAEPRYWSLSRSRGEECDHHWHETPGWPHPGHLPPGPRPRGEVPSVKQESRISVSSHSDTQHCPRYNYQRGAVKRTIFMALRLLRPANHLCYRSLSNRRHIRYQPCKDTHYRTFWYRCVL